MNIIELLGINTKQLTQNQVIMTLNVTENIQQPYGIVHGGINALLAETAASVGANENLQTSDSVAVGIDIMTHHLKPVTSGCLIATAKPISIGRTIQVWQVNITTTNEQLTSVSTVTLKNQVLPK